MIHDDRKSDYDLHQIIAKSLYFGLVSNILLPMFGLFICYWANNNSYVPNRVGDFANGLYYVLGAMSLIQTGVAVWWRDRLLKQPMIRHAETFETDISAALLARSRPVFLLIAGISLYGYLYFFLTGRFNEGAFLVVFSFVVFQIVRPRHGMARKLVGRQLKMVERNEFCRAGAGDR